MLRRGLPGRPSPVSAVGILVLGLSLGLVYGFVEAAANGVFSLVPGALSWQSANAAPIAWVAPLVYVAAFGMIGAIAAGLSLLAPRLPWDSVLVMAVVSLGTYLLAMLQGQLVAEAGAVILGLGVGAAATRGYRARRDWVLTAARRGLPWLAGLVVLAFGAVTVGSRLAERSRMAGLGPVPAGKPNVLLLVLDTERGDHLSWSGYSRKTTPVLDSLAEQGLAHLAAIAPSAWTLPSHATIFTSRRQSEHRAGIMRRPYLDDRFPTLAGQLAAAGYVTGGFVANTFWCGRHTGLARGFHRYRDLYGNAGDAVARTVLGRQLAYRMLPRFGFSDIPGRKSAADVNAEFLDWLDGAGSRPFFGFLNYLDVHAPYRAPAPFDGRYSGRLRRHETAVTIALGRLDGGKGPPPPGILRRVIDSYDEALRYLDAQIGTLLFELKRRGRLENTLIIVTSDHGESFGEHKMMNHGHSLYRDQLHVPLIVSWAGRILHRVEPRAVGIDRIPATVAAAAGLAPGVFRGTSLLDPAGAGEPVLSEMARRWREATRWPSSRASWASIVEGRWHFLAPDSGAVELYDYVADPDEKVNLAGDAAHAARRAALEASLRQLRDRPRLAGAGSPAGCTPCR
jgi:arylsulfatase A-like enzyme